MSDAGIMLWPSDFDEHMAWLRENCPAAKIVVAPYEVLGCKKIESIDFPEEADAVAFHMVFGMFD